MNDYDLVRPAVGRPEVSALAIDGSGSMRRTDYPPTRLDGAKAAASVFLRRKPLIDRRDLTAVLVFNDGARQISQFSIHPVEAELLMHPVAPSGSTNITAGLELALTLVAAPQMKIEPVRRCVLLSDGHHNTGPSPSDAGVLARARREKVIVDCVAIGEANEELLRTIAHETGGRFERCGDVAALRSLYDRLAEKVSTL